MTKTAPLSTSPTTIKKTLTVLKKGREFVAKGWTQHTFHKRAGGKHTYCMLGGLNRAAGSGVAGHWRAYVPNERVPVLDLGERYLRVGVARKTRKRLRSALISTFNDAPRRTQAQVLDAYDIAIARAERDLASVS